MTSPQEISRLVGHHSPAQEEAAAIFNAEDAMAWLRAITNGTLFPGTTHIEYARAALAEIDRLRVALRAVRACNDDSWRAQIVKDALREDEP